MNQEEIERLHQDMDEPAEITGYECLACGHIQDEDDWGGECEMCTSCCLNPIYE